MLILVFSVCFSVVLAGSYAPVPVIEPSPSAYGSPYNSQQQVAAYNYGYPKQTHTVENTIYIQPTEPEGPVEIKKEAPAQPKTYEYSLPVASYPSQQNYEYPSTIYNDLYDTTTTVTTTTTTVAPATEKSEDEENYGVPEIVAPFSPNPIPVIMPSKDKSVGSPSYAPPPQIQPASSAYGSSASSVGEASYNELEYSAGEAVVIPGSSGSSSLNEFYPERGLQQGKKIRAQKKLRNTE